MRLYLELDSNDFLYFGKYAIKTGQKYDQHSIFTTENGLNAVIKSAVLTEEYWNGIVRIIG